MKTLVIHLTFLILFFSSPFAYSGFETGDGGSLILSKLTTTKIFFTHFFYQLNEKDINQSTLPTEMKDWLLGRNGNKHHLDLIKNTISKIKFSLIDDTCQDRSDGIARFICSRDQTIFVSKTLERDKDLDLRILFLHELGHLIGEGDHQFLDEWAAEIVFVGRFDGMRKEFSERLIYFNTSTEIGHGIYAGCLQLKANYEQVAYRRAQEFCQERHFTQVFHYEIFVVPLTFKAFNFLPTSGQRSSDSKVWQNCPHESRTVFKKVVCQF